MTMRCAAVRLPQMTMLAAARLAHTAYPKMSAGKAIGVAEYPAVTSIGRLILPSDEPTMNAVAAAPLTGTKVSHREKPAANMPEIASP